MEGYALLVGVNRTNDEHYGYKNSASNARISVNVLYEYLQENSNIKVVKEDKYVDTRANFKDITCRLETLAILSHQRPIFLFLYMVGHGHNHKGAGDDLFTFFKLYDQMLYENEFKNSINKFSTQSKIFCVLDSCYSGEFVRDKNKFILENPFGIKPHFSDSYDGIIELYKTKLETHLIEANYCPKLIITSVIGSNFADMNSGNRMFFFSYYFLKQLENSSTLNYGSFFVELEKTLASQVNSSGSYQKPKWNTLNSNVSYFYKNKPLII